MLVCNSDQFFHTCIGLHLLSKLSFACQLIAVTQMALKNLVLVVIFVMSVLALTPATHRWSDHTGISRNPLDAFGQLSSSVDTDL